MSTPKDLYPFSTQDGKSIPFEVLDSTSAAKIAINPTATVLTTLPVSEGIVILYSSVDAWVAFAGGLTTLPMGDNTFYPNTTFVPAFTLISAAIRGANMYLSADSADGAIRVQVARKWAGLALPRSVNK